MVPPFFYIAAKRLTLMMLAYSFTRALFLVWNRDLFVADSIGDIGWAFVLGLRFDLSGILMTNLVLLLLWMGPSIWFSHRWMRALDQTVFFAINGLALGTNFIDAEFVKFMGKRTSYDFLFIRGDVQRHIGTVILTYWPLLLMWLSMMIFLWLSFSHWSNEPTRRPIKWWSSVFFRFALVAFAFVGIRGGAQLKPLSPMHAYFNNKHELGLLTLNTPFNLIRTRPRGSIQRERYFATDAEAIHRLNEWTRLSRPPLGIAKNWNVVVFILESFATEYTGIANTYPGYTPFFDSLAKKSFYYKFNFANARRSIEGLPAILCGLPAIMEEPIITSDFANNQMDCLPKLLGDRGYSTHFLHGAHNGSMHFDTFSRLAGFHNFVGLNEYPKNNPEDLDNYWGVLDEPMFQYAIETIDRAPKPTFLSVFSLSSHHPYYIPPKYAGKFPKGTLEIHESIGYTDYALQQFFAKAETKDWFNNTIFIVTADHTQKSDPEKTEYFKDNLGPYRVPLLFFIPGLKNSRSLAFDPERITQHIDIKPTIFDLLGIELENRLLVGQSVFDTAKSGRAYNYTSISYWLLEPNLFIDWGRPPHGLVVESQKNLFQRSPIDSNGPTVQESLTNLRAVVHYMNEGLSNNSLYKWRQKL